MKPIGRYLLGWLGWSAGFYTVSLVLWPSDPSPVAAAIARALASGFFMLLFAVRGDLRASGGNVAYAPKVDIGIGLGGFVLGGAWWYRVVAAPREVRLYVLCGVAAFSLYFLASGVMLARRGRVIEGEIGT